MPLAWSLGDSRLRDPAPVPMEPTDLTSTDQEPRPPPEEPAALGRWNILHRLRVAVRSLYAAGGILLIAGLIAAVLALWALAGLTEEVLAGETLRMDVRALNWLAQYTTPRRDIRALEITSLGSGTVVLTIGVIVGSVLALFGHRAYALLIVLALGGGWTLSPLLKELFGRDRPDVVEWRVPHAGMESFPSGHSMMGMVLYITLAYIIHRIGGRAWVSTLAILLAAVLVTLIGITRVYLGVHYPTDVLAGFAVGFAWAIFCAAGVEMLRKESRN